MGMLGGTGGMFSGHTSNGRVLVVDDEPDIRKVIGMTLTRAGYDVIEAEDGLRAIQVINEGENPLLLDVIITDIRMPKINGVEAINYFQKQYPCVPLIVLTSFPDREMATGFIKNGIVDYLIKPAAKEQLLHSVNKAMEQREIHRL
jgi:two-component system chemotaxis response regulator CheY